MTKNLEGLYNLIVTKAHHGYRRDLTADLSASFASQKIPPVTRVARRTVAVLEAEIPVILAGERICFLRTVKNLPELFTAEEWNDVKREHFIHELGHVCNISPDYGSTIAVGLDARRAEASARLERAIAEGDGERAIFMEALLSELDAVLDLAERYRHEALRLGKTDIVHVLDRVPRRGATGFREALQFFRILHFTLWCEGEYHNTVGRFDQYVWPYLEADLRDGKLDEEEAFDLLEEFFLSFNRDSDLYPGVQQGDNGQSLVLGGLRADGGDGFNLLSKMCLRASKELKLIDPKINLRVGAATASEVYRLGTELTKEGLGFPQYSNDDVVIPGLADLGYPPEDARDYVVAACWEFIIPGKGMDIPNISALSFPAVVLKCIHRDLSASPSFPAFLASVKTEIADECERLASGIRNLWMVPAPFMSLLIDGRVEAGRDVSLGAKYNNFGFHGTGLSTAVDSLAALRKYVFEEASIGADLLVDVLDRDFEGDEVLLSKLRYEGPKMGNGDLKVDALAKELLDAFADGCQGLRNERGGVIRPGTGSAMYYIWHARELGATPDGRRKGEWFGANYSPSLFARLGGPLSIIKSFTLPRLQRVINGGPLTMEFHSSLFDSEESQNKVADLVKLFIQRGGHQMQLNAVNRDKLLDAQRKPEKYGNLIVRVWGWSAYFVELDREYQEHVIRRQEYVVQ
jgi:formate C-acetyltransferase